MKAEGLPVFVAAFDLAGALGERVMGWSPPGQSLVGQAVVAAGRGLAGHLAVALA